MQPLLRVLSILIVLLSGCSFPRIIVLHDPLSAAEHESLGSIYESKGENEPALDQYREAIRIDPKRVSSYLLLGDLSYRLKNYDDAGRAYKKASQLQPDNGDIDNNLCWVYLEQGKKPEEALRLIEQALRKTPEHRAYYLDTKGVVLLRMGEPSAAIAALQESLSLLLPNEDQYRGEVDKHLEEAKRALVRTSQ